MPEKKVQTHWSSTRNKDQKSVGRFLKIWYFNRLLITVPLKMYRKYGRPKIIDFGQPNAEIGQKMANS